jgi:hypothetical protein
MAFTRSRQSLTNEEKHVKAKQKIKIGHLPFRVMLPAAIETPWVRKVPIVGRGEALDGSSSDEKGPER